MWPMDLLLGKMVVVGVGGSYAEGILSRYKRILPVLIHETTFELNITNENHYRARGSRSTQIIRADQPLSLEGGGG